MKNKNGEFSRTCVLLVSNSQPCFSVFLVLSPFFLRPTYCLEHQCRYIHHSIMQWYLRLTPPTPAVYGGPLHQFSMQPPTGFFRDGFCRTGATDSGNHSVAATLSEEFLDFTAARGNDLRGGLGLRGGQKWCLCASRWLEAMRAASGPGDAKVPRVSLHATAQEAIDVVEFKDLKRWALEAETSGAVGGVAPRGVAGEPLHDVNVAGGIARDAHPDVADAGDRSTAKYPKVAEQAEKGQGHNTHVSGRGNMTS